MAVSPTPGDIGDEGKVGQPTNRNVSLEHGFSIINRITSHRVFSSLICQELTTTLHKQFCPTKELNICENTYTWEIFLFPIVSFNK